MKHYTFARVGRAIHIDGKAALYLDCVRDPVTSARGIDPYQADCVSRQLFNALRDGYIRLPESVADTDRLDVHPPKRLYRVLAMLVAARLNCLHGSLNNSDWADRHQDRANALAKGHMPSGSGFDNGTCIDWDASKPDALVLKTAFHHMDDVGGYDGWTEHKVTVRPSFDGFRLSISGRDRNAIKDYINEAFGAALNRYVID